MNPVERLKLLRYLIHYEESRGDHTLTDCPCERMMCRGARCKLCVMEEIMEIEAAMKKEK